MKNEYAVLLGKAGGMKTAQKGKEYYQRIARLSHVKRRENKRINAK